MKEKKSYVYILTNVTNRVLYTGVTSNLIKRVFEHRHKFVKGFTQKYNITKLVYYEIFDDITEAIKREKQLKNWHREWKMNLIKSKNPNFDDLYKTLF